ncbi:CRISPR system precrRNA processing endoribonuclease RAMP protein Cas6 [Synechococcus sp. PCC 7336]|uniref:CRISPR system precrRNA processing endoribonuclease RAMP protein Cas6 n=1 Tax=Synechococcus sp. PCC 7336 TaxID=195250 RepID=UPI001D0D151B|nr:CRISPR system precrRNA processing endoribonuclease RAMP protein Cas6 [Synechococcus sp. PCC 7336]
MQATWPLRVDEPVSLPQSYGLELVRLLHKRLGIEMGSEAVPSTSCSGIVGRCSLSREFVTFEPQQDYWLSLCGLQGESSKAILDLGMGDRLEMLGGCFEVGDREVDVTSYEQMYQEKVAQEPEPLKYLDLEFITPTTFSQNRLYLPLPVPVMMFRSWLERWNRFAPVYLGGDELLMFLGEGVAVSRHRIQSRSLVVGTSRVTGFVGNVSLRVMGWVDPLLGNVARLLVEYGSFAGTGTKTRIGMGCTRVK